MTYMSPAHPDWPEFIERLAGPEACDVGRGGNWRCHNDTSGAETILREHHPDCDLAASLGFFASQGGHCDCEVILNVRPLGGEGYDWLLERARELRGDLMRILAVRPPEQSSMAFEQEFQSACMDLVDALVPEGVEIHAYLAEHAPGAADALAVERLTAAPRGRRASIR
jgi:hypothetical protein